MTRRGFDQRTLRDALGRFATGITVITTMGPGGKPEGLTANSFSALSLDPPLILWCLTKAAPSCPAFSNCSHFAINILRDDQRELSNRFAKSAEDKFADMEWVPGLGGAPLLQNTLAQFECRNENRYEGGDHMIFIGAVEQLNHWEGDPLLFNAGRYAAIANHPEDGGVEIEFRDFADLLL
jgi:4-hydroxyphenylacetate 3-hydroxylase, reductase component